MHADSVENVPGRPPGSWPFALYLRLIEGFAGITMVLILVVMVAQVVARYVFSASLIWAEELCRYVLIWQTFLLLGVAYRRGEFVAVDLVPLMLTPRARLVLKAVMAVPILLFLVLIMIYGWRYAAAVQRQTIPALDFIWTSLAGHNLNVSVRWVYVSVSAGSALLGLHVIADVAESWLRLRQDEARLPRGGKVGVN
ncbi:TRAP transporter small permease [Aquibium sp. LZ166]|uniref:TRAP transporter small permease protein n=1 Tax=Aquibium pacificus TaxID=3153579 RepID=A0ABV3SNV8_9HYPH